MDSKPVLSDHFAKLPSSPDLFPLFYRELVRLRFPIDVAEILELRYLSHYVIDHAENDGQGYEFGEFAAHRGRDMDHVGIHKAGHRERLSQLLLLIRKYHADHTATSCASEARLRAALAENQFAQQQSKRYGKTAGVSALIAAASSILLSPPAVLMQGFTILLAYLSLDYLYSLSSLKREERRLGHELDEILRQRVRAINWKAVVRQTGAILGYTHPLGGEAFRMEPESTPRQLVEIDDF
ncbi:MAG: hypothetical protein ACYDEV_09930 [Acidiferrobacter sp.]